MIDNEIYDLTQTGNQVQAILDNAQGMPTPQQLSNAFALKANASDVYTKNETYSKTEVNRLVGSPDQNYVTVEDYASLPATGSTDTIYRVANYDGENEQVDVTMYSEYAWNGTSYTLLCVKSQIGEVFDISDYNDATYADLSAALGADGANVPASIRRGGMSIKFIQSSDNKYVQYRLMADSWSTNVSDWQGVDDEPTAGSKNLVESGGVDLAFAKFGIDKEYNEQLSTTGSNAIQYTFKAGYSYTIERLTGNTVSFGSFYLSKDGTDDSSDENRVQTIAYPVNWTNNKVVFTAEVDALGINGYWASGTLKIKINGGVIGELQEQINKVNKNAERDESTVYFTNATYPTFTINNNGSVTVILPSATLRLYSDEGIEIEFDLSTLESREFTLQSLRKLVYDFDNNTVGLKTFTETGNFFVLLAVSGSAAQKGAVTGGLLGYYLAWLNTNTTANTTANTNSIQNLNMSKDNVLGTLGNSAPNAVVGKTINSSGTISDNPDIVLSDYIPVTGGTTIVWITGRTSTSATNNGALIEYDANDAVVIGYVLNANSRTITLNSNTVKIRVSFNKSTGVENIGLYDTSNNLLYQPLAKGGLDYRIDRLNQIVEPIATSYKKENGNGLQFFGDQIFHLFKGQEYKFVFIPLSNIRNSQSSSSTADGYFTVKLSDAKTQATIIQKSGITSANAGEEIYLSYIPENDIDVIVGSYEKNTTNSIINVIGKNLSVDIQRSAWDIAGYYSKHDDEIKSIAADSDLRFLFFSDVHKSIENVNRIISLSNNRSEIDCVINGGDTVNSLMTEGLDWYDSIIGNSVKPVLAVPGNHDCWSSSWTWAQGTDIYNMITKKVAQQTSIQQPANAEQQGLNYYYKDFGNIRIICLTAMHMGSATDLYFDTAQKEWFTNVLEDARTTYHYYKATAIGITPHSLQEGDTVADTFSNLSDMNSATITQGSVYAVRMSVIVVTHAPFNPSVAEIISEKLCSWKNYLVGNIRTKGFAYDSLKVNPDAITIVNNYIQNGGSFICWLTGHTHADAIIKHSSYDKQLMVNITTANNSLRTDGVKALNTVDPNFDSFDYIGVDLRMGFIKVLRIGFAQDSSMRVRKSWCYDYVNEKLISEN